MPKLKILCTTKLTTDEAFDVESIAINKGVAPEDVIRAAVAYFCAQCVPTQDGESAPEISPLSFLRNVCPHK